MSLRVSLFHCFLRGCKYLSQPLFESIDVIVNEVLFMEFSLINNADQCQTFVYFS